MKKQIISLTLLAAGFLLGATALSALASGTGTWAAPTATPPGGNVAPPVLTDTSTNPNPGQNRFGLLGLANLVVTNLNIASGTPAVGNVLTSDSVGDASWKPIGALQTPFASTFAFKRSAVQSKDSVVWCPADHPHMVSCGLTSGMAPAASSLTALGNAGCSSSDGQCDTSSAAATGNQRTDLGQYEQYTETVYNGSTWGCLSYDYAHSHNNYKIDLICSQ
jgi:hypothetical protein